jgi:hypothetical protein
MRRLLTILATLTLLLGSGCGGSETPKDTQGGASTGADGGAGSITDGGAAGTGATVGADAAAGGTAGTEEDQGGDASGEPPPPSDTDIPMETLVEVAKAIRANPAEAAAVLDEADLHIGAFEAAMFYIAKQPEKSKKFIEAMK